MMNPEMMRLAQEQMSRMSADDLARMNQQVMSNPGLVKIASESMKNMGTEDFKRAAQQLNQTSPEEIIRMTQKIANAKPEEFADMKAQADAQMSYVISSAKMLKSKGNELHSRGQYTDAAAKYKLAKDNMKNVPSAAGQTLQLQCSLNLMSCYRRGQAYKELGDLKAAVADLSKAHDISPDDETIAEVLRDAEGRLATKGGGVNMSKRVVIEEIVEEDNVPPSSSEIVVEYPAAEIVNSQSMDQPSPSSPPCTTDDMQDVVRNAMKDPAMRQLLESMMKNISPDMMANISNQFDIMPSNKDDAKDQQVMSLDDLEKMMKWMDRVQRGVEIAQKTKKWLIDRKGLIIAIFMLIVAFILLRLFGR